jgi:hypothetical protein
MPADIVNLRRARKAKAHTERERRAAENRAAFGRTKEEKARTEVEKARAEAEFDRHRRETDDGSN